MVLDWDSRFVHKMSPRTHHSYLQQITGNVRTLLNEFLRTPTCNYNFRGMKALQTLKYLKREGVDMADGPGWLPQT